MATITFKDVNIDFPIYNAYSRSLKRKLMQVATGGQIGSDGQGRIQVRALENLNFDFKDGDRIGLIGHNGAGKSTLLRVLNGVYYPSSGSAKVSGKIGSLIDIGLGIDPEATGRENIYIRSALLGIRLKNMRERIEEVINFSGLGAFIDMPVRTYSTGMHLRLAFSVSTLIQPEILLMDEWLSVGDEDFSSQAEARITTLVQSASILVIASHSRQLLEDLCTRIIWLEHGKIVDNGTPGLVLPKYFGKNDRMV